MVSAVQAGALHRTYCFDCDAISSAWRLAALFHVSKNKKKINGADGWEENREWEEL